MARTRPPRKGRRARSEAPDPSAARPTGRRPRRSRRGWIGWGIVLAAIVAAFVLLRAPRAPRTRTDARVPEVPPQAMLDSQQVANERRDWGAALRWATRLAEIDPRNASLVRAQGTALHNVAWGIKSAENQEFTTRTSLDRIALDLQAMALLDSAAGLARDPGDYARTRNWEGQLYEILGLPLDALEIYYDVAQRVPGDAHALGRGRWVITLLRDPQAKAPEAAPPLP